MRIALIHFADLIVESKTLTSAYVDVLVKADSEVREWALHSVPEMKRTVIYIVFTPHSRSYEMDIDNSHLKDSASEILTELAKKMGRVTYPEFGENHLDLLIFCYENAEFDKLNTEVLENLITNTLDNLMLSMDNSECCLKSSKVLSKFFEVALKGDTLISDFENKLGSMFANILNGSAPSEVDNVKRLMEGWISNYGEENAFYT